MAGYTLNDAWCSVENVRTQNALITNGIIVDNDINKFIDDATELIKGRFRARYRLELFTLPLPADLAQVNTLTAKLASFKAAASRPDVCSNTEMTQFVWTLAMKELAELSEGRATLPSKYLIEGSSIGQGSFRGALTPKPHAHKRRGYHEEY